MAVGASHAMQGGKKGRGPKASARPPHDANKERLMYMLTCLTGQLVTVKLKNGQMWEGNFHACSTEGDISITLKTARQIPTGRGKSAEPLDTMVIQGKDFSQVSAMNVPPMEPKSSAFKTDAEIAESWGEDQNRELVAWAAGGGGASPAGVSLQLESTRQIGTWNQFERNEQMFGITSTYSEDLYTTKLDPSKIPEQKRKDAERIAREIESGQNYTRLEEGVADDVDEEAQFSAVDRAAGGSGSDAVHAPLTMENVSQHDAASAEHGDGFAREHRAKRYMITAHSRMPQLSEMKSINALNLEPALPKFDDKTRDDWINFKQSHTRQGQGAGREELQQSLQAIQQKDGKKSTPGDEAEESKDGKFSFNPGAKAWDSDGARTGRQEFSFNPQAASFTPTGSSTARNGESKASAAGGKKDTSEKNSAVAPGPLQNARPATKSFAEFLKPAKPGAKKQTLDDLLSRLFKACDQPQNASPNWEAATGASYKEILGQPAPGSQNAVQLQQQMQMKMAANQSQPSQMSQGNQQMQMQSQANTQQQSQQQQQQMGMQMMQPQGAGNVGGGFIMVQGCGNGQQMLQQQFMQQMSGGGRGNSQQQGMQSQQQQQVGCPQNMMGGQFVALPGGMGQNVGMTGMGVPKFGAQVVPMMVPAGGFPQGFIPQGMQGNMQGMQAMGEGMMPMQNQMMQGGQMQGYRGMGQGE